MKKVLLILLLCVASLRSFAAAPEFKGPVAPPDYGWMKHAGVMFAPLPYNREPFRLISDEILMVRRLAYDKYTLSDVYEFRGKERGFQWDKIRRVLKRIDVLQAESPRWAVLQNYKNKNGRPPLTREIRKNKYDHISDKYGTGRNQSVPMYLPEDRLVPERYGRDGALIDVLSDADTSGMVRIKNLNVAGEWLVPQRYITPLADSVVFDKVIFVDRRNQNIATLERLDGIWYIRSMNPATTGLDLPPYQQATPLGIFVLQEKKEKMWFLVDGTDEIAGYSPMANRFCNGAYIHGVPVNLPAKDHIEYSWSLGTTPRSHMCVRNATSHATFVYDNFPVFATLIVIIE